VCHQTVSLVARHLETAGIPTVVLGSARDIVEHCGVPRFLFVDFPLGNPCGRPWDEQMQRSIVTSALGLFEQAQEPRTTTQAPFQFNDDESWRRRYMQVRAEDAAGLARRGAELRRRRAQSKSG